MGKGSEMEIAGGLTVAAMCAHNRAQTSKCEQVLWRVGDTYHVLPLGEPPPADHAEKIDEFGYD